MSLGSQATGVPIWDDITVARYTPWLGMGSGGGGAKIGDGDGTCRRNLSDGKSA